jgi:NAD(P)-dependent dehydrogenase (short-subunit alcohol dehydrogenase family)
VPARRSRTSAQPTLSRPRSLRQGARVVVSGRRDDAGEALATELRAPGAEVEFIRADGHESEVQNLVDKTVGRFGRLDVAVNNAGTEGKPEPPTPLAKYLVFLSA